MVRRLGQLLRRKTRGMPGPDGQAGADASCAEPILATRARQSLRAQGLTMQFGGVRAVDDLGCVAEAGRVTSLIGPNGAGKSTVIDAITGRRRLTRGQVLLRGEDVTALAVGGRRRRGLSRSFQRTSIFADMPVRKQVVLASELMNREGAQADADDILSELALTALADVRAADLGYGQQRRLDLALALVGRPAVLLLDEPMAGLSVQESRDLAHHLKTLVRRRQVSVLLVEHDMDVVFGISDAITVFELGRVIASGDPAAVRADPRVRKAYLGSAA